MNAPQQPDPFASPPPADRTGVPEQPRGDQSAWQPSGWQPSGSAPGAASAWGPPPPSGASGWQPGVPTWQGQPAGWAAAPQQTETKAVVALVLAISSFVLLPFVPAVAALFVASAARRDIDASYGRLSGRGLVTAARITAWINLGLCLAVMVLAVLAFVLFGFFAVSTSGATSVSS